MQDIEFVYSQSLRVHIIITEMMRLPKDIVSMIDIMLHEDRTQRLIEEYRTDYFQTDIMSGIVTRRSNMQHYNHRELDSEHGSYGIYWHTAFETIHAYKTCGATHCRCQTLGLRIPTCYVYTLTKK